MGLEWGKRSDIVEKKAERKGLKSVYGGPIKAPPILWVVLPDLEDKGEGEEKQDV